MDLPLSLKEENFHFNDTKGFYCLGKNETDFCLDDSKGTSKGTVRYAAYHMSNDELHQNSEQTKLLQIPELSLNTNAVLVITKKNLLNH